MEVSGPQWCSRFPGSASPDDLHPDWRGRVWAFISALERAGAEVKVSATWRPPERAYLMHWCWMIANLSQAPAAIPPMKGVDIDWTHHGDSRAARSAATATDACGAGSLKSEIKMFLVSDFCVLLSEAPNTRSRREHQGQAPSSPRRSALAGGWA